MYQSTFRTWLCIQSTNAGSFCLRPKKRDTITFSMMFTLFVTRTSSPRVRSTITCVQFSRTALRYGTGSYSSASVSGSLPGYE